MARWNVLRKVRGKWYTIRKDSDYRVARKVRNARRRAGQVARLVPVPTYRWVYGDTKGLNRKLMSRLNAVGKELGEKIYVRSGFRTREEQEALYNAYLAGDGPLAAKPGTSRHESGNAADVQIGERSGPNLGSTGDGRRAASKHGLHFPVGGEPWHVEAV